MERSRLLPLGSYSLKPGSWLRMVVTLLITVRTSADDGSRVSSQKSCSGTGGAGGASARAGEAACAATA
jgi:hypothetical protein